MPVYPGAFDNATVELVGGSIVVRCPAQGHPTSLEPKKPPTVELSTRCVQPRSPDLPLPPSPPKRPPTVTPDAIRGLAAKREHCARGADKSHKVSRLSA